MTTENQTPKLKSPLGHSYWNEKGIYQKEYSNLLKLVPNMGEANTVHGEMIMHTTYGLRDIIQREVEQHPLKPIKIFK